MPENSLTFMRSQCKKLLKVHRHTTNMKFQNHQYETKRSACVYFCLIIVLWAVSGDVDLLVNMKDDYMNGNLALNIVIFL